MFCSKTIYKMIETLQKRALRALYRTCDMALDDLLAKDGIAEIHVVNIRALLAEIFKIVHGFKVEIPYNYYFLSKAINFKTNYIR